MKNRTLCKIGINNLQLGEIVEAEAIMFRTDQIQLEIQRIKRSSEILLLYRDFDVKRKEKSTTM